MSLSQSHPVPLKAKLAAPFWTLLRFVTLLQTGLGHIRKGWFTFV